MNVPAPSIWNLNMGTSPPSVGRKYHVLSKLAWCSGYVFIRVETLPQGINGLQHVNSLVISVSGLIGSTRSIWMQHTHGYSVLLHNIHKVLCSSLVWVQTGSMTYSIWDDVKRMLCLLYIRNLGHKSIFFNSHTNFVDCATQRHWLWINQCTVCWCLLLLTYRNKMHVVVWCYFPFLSIGWKPEIRNYVFVCSCTVWFLACQLPIIFCSCAVGLTTVIMAAWALLSLLLALASQHILCQII